MSKPSCIQYSRSAASPSNGMLVLVNVPSRSRNNKHPCWFALTSRQQSFTAGHAGSLVYPDAMRLKHLHHNSTRLMSSCVLLHLVTSVSAPGGTVKAQSVTISSLVRPLHLATAADPLNTVGSCLSSCKYSPSECLQHVVCGRCASADCMESSQHC